MTDQVLFNAFDRVGRRQITDLARREPRCDAAVALQATCGTAGKGRRRCLLAGFEADDHLQALVR